MSLIGIKLADGSFFPVIEHDMPQRKRVVLTVAREGQTSVQIDLLRRDGDTEQYVGCLVLDDLTEGSETEIELVVALDEEGSVEAKISDKRGEHYQSFSVNLDKIGTPQSYSLPDGEGSDFNSDIGGVDALEDIGLPDIEDDLFDGPLNESTGSVDDSYDELPDFDALELPREEAGDGAFLDDVSASSPFGDDDGAISGVTPDDDLFEEQMDDIGTDDAVGSGTLQPRSFSAFALAAIILAALSLIAFGAFGVFRWLQTDALPELRAAA
ncbi:MAG: hypothetical protein MI724_11900, partial [Spirochaetales bacterium]|nr:hypothetical protein [Spirochaetales bacterium]